MLLWICNSDGTDANIKVECMDETEILQLPFVSAAKHGNNKNAWGVEILNAIWQKMIDHQKNWAIFLFLWSFLQKPVLFLVCYNYLAYAILLNMDKFNLLKKSVTPLNAHDYFITFQNYLWNFLFKCTCIHNHVGWILQLPSS